MARQPNSEADVRVALDPEIKQRAIDAAEVCGGSLREVVEAALAQFDLVEAVYKYRERKAREARRAAG